MPEITPFRGIFYNLVKVKLGDVVAPPYDVISPEQQNQLYVASPYNVVRLILGREEDRYASAARYFEQWRAEQILMRDEVPSIYLLAQDFKTPEGTSVERSGFIVRCKLEDFGKGSILPHEKTLAKPKEDRLRLFQATHANFSQIFSLYADPFHAVEASFDAAMEGSAVMDTTFEGVRNRLWRINDASTVTAIRQSMANKTALIADGHHRYETALAYRDSMKANNPRHTGNEPYNFIMMYFTNVHSEGLVILPTHRILHGLPHFDMQGFLTKLKADFDFEIRQNAEELLAKLKSHDRYAFGIVAARQFILCWLKDPSRLSTSLSSAMPEVVKKLDVTVLHSLILEKILGISKVAQEQKQNLDYVKDAHEAIRSVSDGKAQVAFLMNPTPVGDVRAVAEAGSTMPQKSTYFYPKLLSGLIMNSLKED